MTERNREEDSQQKGWLRRADGGRGEGRRLEDLTEEVTGLLTLANEGDRVGDVLPKWLAELAAMRMDEAWPWARRGEERD